MSGGTRRRHPVTAHKTPAIVEGWISADPRADRLTSRTPGVSLSLKTLQTVTSTVFVFYNFFMKSTFHVTSVIRWKRNRKKKWLTAVWIGLVTQRALNESNDCVCLLSSIRCRCGNHVRFPRSYHCKDSRESLESAKWSKQSSGRKIWNRRVSAFRSSCCSRHVSFTCLHF